MSETHNTSSTTIRPYQAECIHTINAKGDGRWLVQMATGLGKGYIMPHIHYPGRTLFLAHRTKLIEQNSEGFTDVGIEHGQHTAGDAKHVFTTVQSLHNRLRKFTPDAFHTIVLDEAHRYAGNQFEETLSHFTPKRLLGFTATPNRSDGRPLSLFDEIIYEKDIRFGITNGYLTPIHCERIDIEYDLSNVRVHQGDFNVKGLSKAVNIESAVKAVAKVFEDAPKPALVFAVDIAHAEALAAKMGIPAVTSHSKHIPETLAAFTRGEHAGLVSVEMFTEGINLNNAVSLIMARPTQSPLLYTQIVGRIVRQSPGKDKAYLYDCVGVTSQHSLCTAPTLLGLDTDALTPQGESKLIGDLINDLPELIEREANTPESWIKNRKVVALFAKRNKLNLYGLAFVKHPDGSLVISLPDNKWIGMSPINHLQQARMIGSKGNTYPLKPAQEVINDIVKTLNAGAKDSQTLWLIKRQYKWGKEPASAKQKLYIQRLLARTPHARFNVNNLNKVEAATIITRLKYEGQRSRKNNP